MAVQLTNSKQSRSKPKLVAKILATNFGLFVHELPKSVPNISSQFHHFVNTGLAVRSLVERLLIKVTYTCKLDTIWVVYCSLIGIGSIWL